MKTKRLHIRIEEEMLNEFKKYCIKNNTIPSKYIRGVIKECLNEKNK